MRLIRNYILEQFLTESPYGEYWILDGQLVGADGDTGDYNHEAYAFQSMMSELYETLDMYYEDGDVGDVEMALPEIVKKVSETNPEDFDYDSYRREGKKYLIKALSNSYKTKDSKRWMSLLKCLFGNEDSREFAIQYYGWKRLKGTNVETYHLTSSDLREIGNGIWDAYDEEAEQETFNIEVRSNRKFYTDVPYEVISDGRISELHSYQSSY